MTVQEIELRRKMDKLARDAQAIALTAAKENRAMTSEEQGKFDKMFTEVTETKTAAEREAANEQRMKDMAQMLINPEHGGGATGGGEKKEHRAMFDKYLRGGIRTDEAIQMERRDFKISADNIGGVAVPTDVYPLMEVALKPWDAMENVAQIIKTSGGEPLKMTSINDTGTYAELSGEAQSANGGVANTDDATPFGDVALGGWLYDTKIIGISYQLFEDAAIDIQAILLARMGERFGRAFNQHCTVGDGNSKPNGIITALAANGATPKITTASGTAIAAAELQALPFKIYAPYRLKAKWMCSDSVLSFLATLADQNLRPLWLPSFGSLNVGPGAEKGGWASTLLGWPVQSNLEMAAMPTVAGADNYTVVFGDMTAYKMRFVGGPRILRLDEVLATKGEVGFIGYQRIDGDFLDAGTHPVAYIVMKAN